jgi:hypothetical protein
VLAWVEQSLGMHPSLQWVKLWPWVMIVGMHIQEERRRGVEMLLSGSVFNGWKWLYEIVMVCCTPFALVSWRWRRRKRERERSGITDPRGSLEFFLNVVQCSWPSTSVFHWEIPSAPVRIGACRLMDQHPHQIASCMRTTPVFMWHFRFDVSLLIMDNWWQLMIWGI